MSNDETIRDIDRDLKGEINGDTNGAANGETSVILPNEDRDAYFARLESLNRDPSRRQARIAELEPLTTMDQRTEERHAAQDELQYLYKNVWEEKLLGKKLSDTTTATVRIFHSLDN
jgi:hypothetical protein